MKIAIVEDQEKEAEELQGFLSKYCREQYIMAEFRTFSTGAGLLSEIETANFDLVFLDIYLEGINGIEVAQTMREKGFEGIIIFSTVSTDHAVSGYSVQAFDYLVKPYSYAQFRVSMDRCMQCISNKQIYISVKEQRTHVKILLDDIIYTDYHNHYIQIHTQGRTVRSYMSFSEFFELLKPHPQFINCYRNCVVNMDYVSCMKGYDFILKTGDIIPITRKQKTAIKQAYADYEFFRLKRNFGNS